ncbi:MAG: hypothetical protein EOP04_06015 [Proteobacteria bacterium]|nr:MAG: hypothetical protein EOP04_06015 [Pseudomonadota bacterium]
MKTTLLAVSLVTFSFACKSENKKHVPVVAPDGVIDIPPQVADADLEGDSTLPNPVAPETSDGNGATTVVTDVESEAAVQPVLISIESEAKDCAAFQQADIRDNSLSILVGETSASTSRTESRNIYSRTLCSLSLEIGVPANHMIVMTPQTELNYTASMKFQNAGKGTVMTRLYETGAPAQAAFASVFTKDFEGDIVAKPSATSVQRIASKCFAQDGSFKLTLSSNFILQATSGAAAGDLAIKGHEIKSGFKFVKCTP